MRKNFIPDDLYRKIVEVIPICCVDLLIKNSDSFLLVKRLENPAKGEWWFPGGRVLFKESLLQASARKLKEELNIKNFKNMEFLGVQETEFPRGKFGKPSYTINNVFQIEINKKDVFLIRPDGTMSEYKWFNAIPGKLHPYVKKFLKTAGFK